MKTSSSFFLFEFDVSVCFETLMLRSKSLPLELRFLRATLDRVGGDTSAVGAFASKLGERTAEEG